MGQRRNGRKKVNIIRIRPNRFKVIAKYAKMKNNEVIFNSKGEDDSDGIPGKTRPYMRFENKRDREKWWSLIKVLKIFEEVNSC